MIHRVNVVDESGREFAFPFSSEEEALEFLEQMKKLNLKAKYISGDR